MQVSINGRPKPKKTGTMVTTIKRSSEGKTTVDTPTITHGQDKSTYTPARTMTGDKRYGNESAGNKDAKFIQDARDKKQDIARDSEGKPYRAGYTKTERTPDSISPTKINVPKLKLAVQQKTLYDRTATEKPTKLKAMGMTYGTDSAKGGGTSRKMKVRAR